MKIGDVYSTSPLGSVAKIVAINGKIIEFEILSGYFEGLVLFWAKEDFEGRYMFNQKLTDEYIIKNIIE